MEDENPLEEFLKTHTVADLITCIIVTVCAIGILTFVLTLIHNL